MNPLNYLRIAALAVFALAIAAGLWKVHHTGYVDGKADVQAEWDTYKAQLAEENAHNLQVVALNSNRLQGEADKERGTLNAHIHSVELERDDLFKQLRAREARPADSAGGMPPSTGSGPDAGGCTGARLYREDGEFLAGEAAAAKSLAKRLAACEADYDRVKDTINLGAKH